MKYLLLACIMICIAPTTHAQPAVTKKDPPLFVPYRDGKLWGYSDTMGKVLVQPAYDSVSQHSVDGFVYKNGKVGIINEWGKVKLATLYDDIYSDAPYDETFYVASKSSKKGVFNNNGKPLVPMIYDTIQSIEERIIVVGTKNKRGLYTIAGKLLVPVEYDEITDQFFDEKADHSRSIMGRKGNKYWLLSKATGRAYPYIFKGDDSEEGVTEEVMANVVEDYNDSVSNSADSVKKRFQADRVVDISFTKGYISKDYLLVIKNGKQGLFHRPSNRLAVPVAYDSILYSTTAFPTPYLPKGTGFLVAVRKNGKVGLINDQEQEILPFVYDHIGQLANNLNGFELESNNKRGIFLMYTSYPVIPPKYDLVEYAGALQVNSNWNFSLYRVWYNGQPGYVGENGVEYFK